jgi:hypothetical protein
MEIPQQRTIDNQNKLNPVLQALITNDCNALKKMNAILLQDNEIEEWAHYYYNSDYSDEKNKLVDTVLCKVPIIFEVPSLLDIALQEVSRQFWFKNLAIDCLPQELQLKVKSCIPLLSYKLLKHYCADLTVAESSFIEGTTNECNSHRGNKIRLLKACIDKYLTQRALVVEKCNAIFGTIQNVVVDQKIQNIQETVQRIPGFMLFSDLNNLKKAFIDAEQHLADFLHPGRLVGFPKGELYLRTLYKMILPNEVSTLVIKNKKINESSHE